VHDSKWRPGLSREEAKRRSKINREMTVRQNRKKAERTAQASASGGRELTEVRPARTADVDWDGESLPTSAGKDRRHRRDRAAGSISGADAAPGAKDGTGRVDAPPPVLYDKLPAELWQRILSLLDPCSACRAACCDRQLAQLVSDPAVWLSLHSTTFGTDPIFGPGTAAAAVGLLHGGEGEAAGARGPTRQRFDETESIPGGFGAPETVRPAATAWSGAPSILGLSARRRCCESEASISHWRRACTPGAAGLAVPGLSGMLGGCFVHEFGVSVHTDNITRLWEADSGRRLAAFQHRGRANLTCVAGAECGSRGPAALVGDSAGQVRYS
jgi:hypothetical protein